MARSAVTTKFSWIATGRFTHLAVTKAHYPTDGGMNSRDQLRPPAHHHP
jgi:hypothetical protein